MFGSQSACPLILTSDILSVIYVITGHVTYVIYLIKCLTVFNAIFFTPVFSFVVKIFVVYINSYDLSTNLIKHVLILFL